MSEDQGDDPYAAPEAALGEGEDEAPADALRGAHAIGVFLLALPFGLSLLASLVTYAPNSQGIRAQAMWIPGAVGGLGAMIAARLLGLRWPWAVAFVWFLYAGLAAA